MNDWGVAISKYERAIEILSRLRELYPNIPQSKKYADYINQYKVRIK